MKKLLILILGIVCYCLICVPVKADVIFNSENESLVTNESLHYYYYGPHELKYLSYACGEFLGIDSSATLHNYAFGSPTQFVSIEGLASRIVSTGSLIYDEYESGGNYYCGTCLMQHSVYHTTGHRISLFYTYIGVSKESKTTLKNCNTTNLINASLTGIFSINGGAYKGVPAVMNAATIVNKGTITDIYDSMSLFTLGEDSEQTVTTNGATTITTVKLSNPPVIIDWADFPG